MLFSFITSSTTFEDQDSHRAAALKLLEVAKTEDMLVQMKAHLEQMMIQQMNAVDLAPEAKQEFSAIQQDLMEWVNSFFGWEAMKDLYVDIYVEVFSEDELKELIAFYQSPLGQKMIAKMPELMQKSMEKTQLILQAKMPEFRDKLNKTVEELQAKYKK